MRGAVLFREAADPIIVHCKDCGRSCEFTHKELIEKGLGTDAPMPSVLRGLARLLGCERAHDQSRDLTQYCRLAYKADRNANR